MLYLPKTNHFTFEHYRSGHLIQRLFAKNLVTTAGKNHALDVFLAAATRYSTWYIGLIAASPTPVISVTDTLASHTGWAEITDLSAARVAWSPNAASGGSKTTATASSFTATGTISIKGFFLTNVASGTSGILFSAGLLSTNYDLINTDTFAAKYTANGL